MTPPASISSIFPPSWYMASRLVSLTALRISVGRGAATVGASGAARNVGSISPVSMTGRPRAAPAAVRWRMSASVATRPNLACSRCRARWTGSRWRSNWLRYSPTVSGSSSVPVCAGDSRPPPARPTPSNAACVRSCDTERNASRNRPAPASSSAGIVLAGRAAGV